MRHHHHFPHLSHKQMLLLYLARQHAEDTGPPTAWDKFATVISGLVSLVALGCLGVLVALAALALVVVIVG